MAPELKHSGESETDVQDPMPGAGSTADAETGPSRLDDLRIMPGWYSVDGHIESGGHAGVPVLLFDEGNGVDCAERLSLAPLKDPRNPSRVCGVVLLLRPGRSLSLEAGADAGASGLKVRRVSRLKAGLLLMHMRLRWHPIWRWPDIVARSLCIAATCGVRQMVDELRSIRLGDAEDPAQYARWLEKYDGLRRFAHADSEQLAISILLPVYNPDPVALRACLDSVTHQLHQNWQLCIVDDASDGDEIKDILHDAAESDSRLRVLRRITNGHISRATNDALAMASGEFVALLDHDDVLHPHALAEVASALMENRHWDLVFTDEDKIDADGMRKMPYFKPDFSPDLLCGQNCISHLGVYRTSIVRDLGGLRPGLEGSQDWDLALRFAEAVGPERIGHIARVLYHWRISEGSTAFSHEAKPYARESGKLAVSEHMARLGVECEVESLLHLPGYLRVKRLLRRELPSVSVIIPTRNNPAMLLRCLSSLAATAGRITPEVIIVDNGSTGEQWEATLAEIRRNHVATVIRDDRPFNYSALNNAAVARSCGQLILLMNDDVEAIEAGWIEEMAAHSLRPEVGAVGAKLLYPDGRIQHAGIFLGVNGIAANAYRGAPAGAMGSAAALRLVRNPSAVTGACLMLRREVYQGSGGLDETLPVAYNDVDLCLRLRSRGLLVVWTPFATLMHHESSTRSQSARARGGGRDVAGERAADIMRARWPSWVQRDPAFSPNYSDDSEIPMLAFPPR